MLKSILLPVLFLLGSVNLSGQGYTFDEAVMCSGVNGNQYYVDEKYTFMEGEPIIAWIRFSSLNDSRLQIFAQFPGLGTIQPTYECCGEVIGYYSPYAFGTSLPPGDYSVNFSALLVDSPYPPGFITTLEFTVVAPSATVNVSTLRHDNGDYDVNNPFLLAQIDNANQLTEVVKVATDSSEATLVEVVRNGSTPYKVFATADPNSENKDIYGSFEWFDENDLVVKFRYKHPSQLIPGLFINVSVANESTGQTELQFRFKTVRPPVLLLHGQGKATNGGAGMENLKTALADAAYTEFESSYIQNPSYDGASSFIYTYPIVGTFINDLLESARSESRVSAGKVDIVGYSMGGLLSRMYLQSDLYIENINKLITINTPHSGSELANHRFVDWLRNPVYTDLNTNSAAIRYSLNGPRLNHRTVSSHTITSTDIIEPTQYCQLGSTFIQLICAIGRSRIFFCEDQTLSSCIFYGKPNDLIVSQRSQAGGLSATSSVGNQTDHWEVIQSTQTLNLLDDLLEENANSAYFSKNGFFPDTINLYNNAPDDRNALSIQITQPLHGETVAAGQTIEVKVEGSPEMLASLLVANAVNLDTIDIHSASGSTATFNITVPLDAGGLFRIGVFGKDADRNFVLDTIALNIQGVVGTHSNQEASPMPYRVFPNPTTQSVLVENLDADVVMQCSLYNLDGKLKEQFEVAPQSRFQLATGDLPSGAFILKCQTGRQVFTTRLVRL